MIGKKAPSDVSIRPYDIGHGLVRLRQLAEWETDREAIAPLDDRACQAGATMETLDSVGRSTPARPVPGQIPLSNGLMLASNLVERFPERAPRSAHA